MPMLFYGTTGDTRKRCLHGGKKLEPIKSSVFDKYKVDKLAPHSRLTHVANFWHFVDRGHSAISWHDERGIEQTVFIPALLSHIDAIAVARQEYPEVMPPPLTFRINNEDGVYLYHD